MPVNLMCVQKIRDKNKVIKSYVLQDQTGQQVEVKRQGLLEMMHNPHCNFINLKLSIDGRIIDKTEITSADGKSMLTSQDYIAALFRSNYETQGKTIKQIRFAMQDILHNELETGQISISTLSSLSYSLERVANIRSMETDSGIHVVTGYLLKNIGEYTIPYKRIDTESNQESLSVIQPNETKALTRLETTTLLMDARFSFKIHNAKMYLGHTLGLGRREDMIRCYLYKLSDQDKVRDILYTKLPESEWARFCRSDRHSYFKSEKALVEQIKNNKDIRNASKPNDKNMIVLPNNKDIRSTSKPIDKNMVNIPNNKNITLMPNNKDIRDASKPRDTSTSF